ncbi:Hint domain-containing protein [Microdochium nivale]|nr:Hint domain-containing protein [Microdochium nivale]
MSSSVTATELVREVVEAIATLPPFPILPFMQRLYNKAQQTQIVKSSGFQLPVQSQYGSDDGLLLDGVDQSAALGDLAASAIVNAVSSLDDGTDKSGFRACVNGTVAQHNINSNVLSLTSLLIAEHINWHLAGGVDSATGASQALPSLHDLAAMPDFVEKFGKLLHDPHFIRGQISHDVAQGDHIFSLALLFMGEYLHKGPGFIALDPHAFSSSTSREVLVEWSLNLAAIDDVDMEKTFSFITYVASGVVLPDVDVGLQAPGPNTTGTETAISDSGAVFPSGSLSQIILDTVWKPTVGSLPSSGQSLQPTGTGRSASPALLQVDSLAQQDMVELQTIAMDNLAQWNTMGSDWIGAVSKMANVQTQTSSLENNDVGSGYLEGITFGLAGGADTYITTTTGQDLADWMDSVRSQYPQLFTSTRPDTVQVTEHHSTPAGNCFIAGTKVMTDAGEINIEDIREGTRVLTDANAERYGIASDEDVATPLGGEEIMLVGFNNEGVFATAGHIFLTTTGHRAILPELAMMENSFFNVGRLARGHALYRLSQDAKTYDVVPIDSIQVQFVRASTVHGVHLREGERAYHANGYHVAVNYPEIIISSVARALAQLPRHQAIKALQQIKELGPVFHKIGVPGVARLLKQELRGTRRGAKNVLLQKNPKHQALRYQGTNFQDMNRAFTLTATDSPLTDKHGPEGYVLPTLAVHEGVLLLDDIVVPRVDFDVKGSKIRWSRPLGNELGHEHGSLKLTTQGFLGTGAVFVSQQGDASKLPETHETIVPFLARATAALSEVADSSGRSHATTTRPPIMEVPTTFPGPTGTVSAQAVPGMISLMAMPPSAPPPSATPTAESTTPAIVPVAPSSVTTPPAKKNIVNNVSHYKVFVDTEEWPAGVAKAAITASEPMGKIGLGTYHTDGEGGLAIAIVTVPALDQLLADINSTRAPESQLKSFYESSSIIGMDGAQLGYVTFTDASAVALMSDNAPKTQGEPLPTRNLTFTNVKSSVTIPILFQSLEFKVKWNYESLNGALYEFDPSMQGNTGSRHWFGTSHIAAAQEPTGMRTMLALASATARTTVHAAATGTSIGDGSHTGLVAAAATTRPSPVTFALATPTVQPLTTQGIAEISGYSEEAVHQTSQTLLQNMMYYHMSESDRTQFLQFPKPTNLPFELAESLPQNLQDWISDIYAPAYISFMLSQVSPSDSSSWRVNFTDDEKNMIWYWWSGSDAQCLAQQAEYQEINTITSSTAMIQLYGATINPYLPEAVHWGASLLAGWTTPLALQRIVAAPMGGGSTNMLNMYCNILHALDPNPANMAGFGQLLFNAVVTYAQSHQTASTAVLNDPTGEAGNNWCFDVMASLVQKILSNDPSLDSTVRNDLLSDMNQLQKELGISEKADADLRAKLLVAHMGELTSSMAMWSGGLVKGAPLIFKGVSSFLQGSKTFNKAAAALEKVSATAAKKMTPRMTLFCKGLGILTLAAGYATSAIFSFREWKKLSTARQIEAVLVTAKVVFDVAGQSIKAWKEFKSAPLADVATPTEAANGTVLGQGLRDEMAGGGGKQINIELAQAEHDPQAGQKEFIEAVGETATGERKVQASDLTEGTEFNKPLPPPDAGDSAWGRFNTPTNWLRGINIVVSIALVVVMSISLANNWDSFTATGKALSVLQVVTSGLSIAVDAAMFVGEMLVMETAMFAVVLPIVGAVLAVIGLVVTVLEMTLGITKPKPPPPTPIELFISNTARPLMAAQKWAQMPTQNFTYTMPSSVTAGSAATTFTISAQNATGTDVSTVTSVRITVQGGSDPTCLFTELSMTDLGMQAVPNGSTTSVLLDGQVAAFSAAAGPPASALTEAISPTTRTDSITSWDSIIQGVADATVNPLGNLLLKGAGGIKEGFNVSFCGAINAAGSNVVQIVEVLTSGDSCRSTFTVTRI